MLCSKASIPACNQLLAEIVFCSLSLPSSGVACGGNAGFVTTGCLRCGLPLALSLLTAEEWGLASGPRRGMSGGHTVSSPSFSWATVLPNLYGEWTTGNKGSSEEENQRTGKSVSLSGEHFSLAVSK